MVNELKYKRIDPPDRLADFVESFWMLELGAEESRDIIVLPDGKIDLFFSRSATEPFHVTLSGLETMPDQATLAAGTVMFAISFKLLSIEYILKSTVAGLIDTATYLPVDFWGFNADDLCDFEAFSRKAAATIQSFLPAEIDSRKRDLFSLLYSTKGNMPVGELAAKVYWSSRQINRYFSQQFGLSLKAYCNILRFRASFTQINAGKLFPQENFADQSHFIREVKKLSGVSPKELKRNQNDRFIQFSVLDPE
jgi:AraC-like DNA-binding protein